MIKFFFFSSLAHLCLIISSSVIPQDGDIEKKRYDDYGLMSAYRRYLNKPIRKTYFIFEDYVVEYFEQSPVDCLKLSSRNQDWVFRVAFWFALAGSYERIDPSKITAGSYSKVLVWISDEIMRRILLNCSCFNGSEFKAELETITQLVKSAEITSSGLKTLGIKDKLVNEFVDRVVIWKYLIRKISIDFENQTIDYHSLFRTINEIRFIIKTDSSSINPSLHLSKRYALLFLYLRHIFSKNCTVIFETHHQLKAFTINLIMDDALFYQGDNEFFFPSRLRLQFEKIIKGGPWQLGVIKEILGKKDVQNYCFGLGIKSVSSFVELTYFLDEGRDFPSLKWQVRALGEIERYLARIS